MGTYPRVCLLGPGLAVTKFVGAGPTPDQLQFLAAVSVSKMYFGMFNAAAVVLPVKYYPLPLRVNIFSGVGALWSHR